MKSKTEIILEKEERIALINYNKAKANRELVVIENRKVEIEKSFQQWDDEINKLEKEISQLGDDNV